MSGERSGNRNNSRAEAVHESSNTPQPTRSPGMFHGASGNTFEGGTFNNAGGNIRELPLVSADVDHLLTTIHRYDSQITRK